MHEIAKATTVTFAIFILPTACFSEIRDWGEFSVKWATCIPPVIQIVDSGLSFVFPFKPSIHVSNQMITNVVADMKFHEVTKFGQLAVEIFIHRIKTLLELTFVELASRIVCRIVINVGKEYSLRERWLDVFSRATISMATGTYFVVE